MRDRLRRALQADYADKWSADFKRGEALLAATVTDFKRIPLFGEIIAIFSQATAIDKEVSGINSRAPDGERRRLQSVENQSSYHPQLGGV